MASVPTNLVAAALIGTHRGPGIYGPPGGRRITMWGITQHRIVHGRISEEWMIFNEFEVMQQIYRREEDLIIENWVPVDMLYLFDQMGVDVLGNLREARLSGNSAWRDGR